MTAAVCKFPMGATRIADVEPHDRVLVLGKTGTGKSNFAKALVDREMSRGTPIVVWDVEDEYSRWGQLTDYVRLGTVRDRCTFVELTENPDLLDAGELSLAVVPENLSAEECGDAFAQFAGMVRDTGNLVCVVEEVGYFGEYAEHALNQAACRFRKRGVGLVLVAQRAVQVPKTARTQASQIYSGRQDDPADVRALDEITGADQLGTRVSQLRRGAPLAHWRDTTEEKGK